jgi:NADPH-dependent 2,4-dienoyl-CoA reductase/sulfur reductase-like enzyme
LSEASRAARLLRLVLGDAMRPQRLRFLKKGPLRRLQIVVCLITLAEKFRERDKLIVASAELFWDRFRIRVRTGHEVTAIDRDAQTVTGRKVGDGEEFKLPYDRLILSTGSTPIRPGFQRVESENVFSLWTLDDMDSILASMRRRRVGKAVVVGAGFVGLEVAEQLAELGTRVAVVQDSPQVLNPLDAEMAKLVERELQREGRRALFG